MRFFFLLLFAIEKKFYLQMSKVKVKINEHLVKARRTIFKMNEIDQLIIKWGI